LFKATHTEHTRAPSIGSIQAFRPAGEVALVVHSRVLRPAPCRSPRALPASSKAGSSFRAISPARILAGCPAPHRATEKDASLRLLQPTHDTSTQYAVRFPISRPSSSVAFRPHSLPARDGPPVFTPTRARALADTSTGESSGGASLDGEPPASASPQPTRGAPGFRPRSPPATSTARSGRSLDRRLLRAMPPGRGLFDRAPSMQLGL
jgi:hypothetical protein